jgi:sortase A
MIAGMARSTLEPPSAPPRSGRGVTFWAGTVLVLAGLVLLGYVAWQFFGTNVVAHHKQQQLVERTERMWGKPAAKPGDDPDLKGAEALVRIPRFGKDYLIPVQKGVSTDVLAEGFGHFNGTAAAGQVGNYALAGHRVTHGEPLRKMPDLRPDDEVIVETAVADYVYRIDTDPEDLIIPFTSTWVLDPVPENPESGGPQPLQKRGQRLITLTTCSEIFHTDDRMIAFGHLVKTIKNDR